MNLSWGKTRRSIARSVVTILVLTLLQSVASVVSFPEYAQAATVTTGACTIDAINLTSASVIDSSTVDGTCLVRFTSSSSSLTAPTGVNSILVAAVGGGGSGGFGSLGGGGGAGSVIYSSSGVSVNSGQNISVSVGAGAISGMSASDQSTWSNSGKSGETTSVTIGSNTFLASGGGGGGGNGRTSGLAGGSGGGSAAVGGNPAGAAFNIDYAGWVENANSGYTSTSGSGGGGGGAGAAATGYNGAIGVTVFGYKVGGGGGGWQYGNANLSWEYGGGYPKDSNYVCPSNKCNGVANTGGGGGAGGNGGSGVAMIKFIPAQGQGTIAQSNGFTINRKTTFAFTRTGIAPTSTTASYQWQVKTSGSSTWNNVSTGTGGTTLNYQTGNLESSDSGNTYRIAVTDSHNSFGISTTTYTEVGPLSLFIPPGGETDSALSISETGDAATQYAYVNHTSDLVLSNSLTIEAWVKPTGFNVGGWSMVVSKELSYELGITSSAGSGVGYWNYGLKGSGWNGINTGVKAVLNEWHHIAITRASGTDQVKFYLDGFLAYTGLADGVGTGTISDSNLPLTIGARYNDGNGYLAQFKGQIDHVAIFNSVRTQSDIQSDMNTYNLSGVVGLLAYYDFNESTGSTVYNRKVGTTSASDLTLVGSSLFTDVKVVDTTTLPAYTILKFPRTYLTSIGGWKVPANIPKVSILGVAGGGAGGSRVGGGGGAGGYVYRGSTQLTGGSVETITVGVGGIGIKDYAGKNGLNTLFGTRITAIGGGGGGASNNNGERTGRSGGSGGGSGDSSLSAGSSTQITSGSTDGLGSAGANGEGGGSWSAGGGGGATAPGFNGTNATYPGWGGTGSINAISGVDICYSAGGGGGIVGASAGTYRNNGGRCAGMAATGGTGSISSTVGGSATANTGSGGGGAGYGLSYDEPGGNGGSGIIVVRWITASVPTYTKPTNAYLNLGMTESFSVNVASDSTTVNLTRNFRWESSTAGTNGPFSLIKQGTGASNASFSWVPTDTSTSGSNYLYRLIVTDSDTAGLFITDSSTAFAIINRSLVVSGTAGIAKSINVSKSETFTITLGTSTYRTTLTSNNPGITLDTSTATSPVVRIAETMTVGTYFETLTVVDSVSASVVTPLTIVVAAPPQLTNSSEIVDSGQIFNLDFSHSGSFNPITKALSDISGGMKSVQAPNGISRSDDYSGIATLSQGSSQYIQATGFKSLPVWSIETYIRLNDTPAAQFCPFASEYGPNTSVAMFLCFDSTRTVFSGFLKYDTSAKWSFKRTQNTIPVNTWVHVLSTFDGSAVNIYFDGISQAANTGDGGRFDAGFFPPAAYSNKVFIGKDYTTAVGTTANISLGLVRVYDRALTLSQVTQNLNATKDRFISNNLDKIYPSVKYGNRISETYTASSGYGGRTISYANGSKPGLNFNTSGGNTVLQAFETLTATTHYETITVTDSLGASSFLPIKVIINKADTLTISMDTSTTVVYNSAPITVYPKIYFKGLAGVDTLTASTRFTSLTYTDSATVPTDVDTYTVIAANPVFSVGSLSNYVNVVYETSTAKVTQANQNKLSINLYGAVAGTPFLIQTFGGSGDGAVTESVTAGGSATGCTVSNHVLSNTSPSTQQLTCNILVTKAASKNYKVETMTATVYFMLYVNNMPTNQVGSGSTIGLNGINSVWVDPGATPTITGPGAGTYAANSPITITGTGFSLGPITVKFERNQLATNITVASDTSMTVTIPAGARSGLFSVTNKNGTEFSSFAITIG